MSILWTERKFSQIFSLDMKKKSIKLLRLNRLFVMAENYCKIQDNYGHARESDIRGSQTCLGMSILWTEREFSQIFFA